MKLLLLINLVFFQTITYAADCNHLFQSGKRAAIDLTAQPPEYARTLQLYETLAAQSAELRALVPEELVNQLLLNVDFTVYVNRLNVVLSSLRSVSTINSEVVKNSFRSLLTDLVPSASIETRISEFQNSPTSTRFQRILGEMEINEVRDFTYGVDPLHPSADSLLGKYLSETNASSVIRTFSQVPDQASSQQGNEKLVVAVSEATWPIYAKYFTKQEFLIHFHTPEQGTLELMYNGKIGSYGIIVQPIYMPSPGTLLPHILLNSREAQRTTNFFELASRFPNSALTPWELVPYCAHGGYDSCTHWSGNIPVGDELVDEYWFPGNVDESAGGAPGPEPQHKILEPYELPTLSPQNRFLINRTWKVPGNMQLSEVLGTKEQNITGEWANPGYVAITLTSRTTADRVPVVFVVVTDHTSPLAPNFDTFIHAY